MTPHGKPALMDLVTEQEDLLPDGFDAAVFDAPAFDGDGFGVDGEAVELQLSDLVPDADGEIVVFNDTDAPIRLTAEGKVVASGLADPHVTAAGIDVTGMQFSMLDSGLTVYHDPEVNLTFG